MRRAASATATVSVDSGKSVATQDNCGTGKGGFQRGNTCAAGGDEPESKTKPKKKPGLREAFTREIAAAADLIEHTKDSSADLDFEDWGIDELESAGYSIGIDQEELWEEIAQEMRTLAEEEVDSGYVWDPPSHRNTRHRASGSMDRREGKVCGARYPWEREIDLLRSAGLDHRKRESQAGEAKCQKTKCQKKESSVG